MTNINQINKLKPIGRNKSCTRYYLTFTNPVASADERVNNGMEVRSSFIQNLPLHRPNLTAYFHLSVWKQPLELKKGRAHRGDSSNKPTISDALLFTYEFPNIRVSSVNEMKTSGCPAPPFHHRFLLTTNVRKRKVNNYISRNKRWKEWGAYRKLVECQQCGLRALYSPRKSIQFRFRGMYDASIFRVKLIIKTQAA